MDRCALFVDAGYVLADGAMAVHGTRRRESVSWDYGGLLQLLASQAMERSRLPLLRCYWYEATAEGQRSDDHEALADLPGVKLRVAKMWPGRREGSEIQRDLTTLARNKAVSDAMVVSAEENLAQVISDVQDMGMRVTLLNIAVDGSPAVSRALRQECDDIVEITSAQLRPYVELIPGAEPPRPDEREGAVLALRPAVNGNGNGNGGANGNGRGSAGRTGTYAQPSARPGAGQQPPATSYPASGASGASGASDYADYPEYPDYQRDPGQQERAESTTAGSGTGTPGTGYPGTGYPAADYPAADYPAADYAGGGAESGAEYGSGPAYGQAAEYAAEYSGPSPDQGVTAAEPAPLRQDQATSRQDTPLAPQERAAALDPQQGRQDYGVRRFAPRPELAARAEPPARDEPYAAPVAAPAAADDLAVERPSARPRQEGELLRPVESGYNPGAVREQYQADAMIREPLAGDGADRYQPVPVPIPLPANSAQVRRLPARPGQPGPTAGRAEPTTGPPSGAWSVAPAAPTDARGMGYSDGRGGPYGGPRPIGPGQAGQAGPAAASGPMNFADQPSSGPAPSGPSAPMGPAGQQPMSMPVPPGPGSGIYPVQHQGPAAVPIAPVPSAAQAYSGGQSGASLADAVQSAHEEGQAFGESVARDAPALWLEAVLARKPRMPSDLEARLLQGSALPIDFLLHDEVRHALRRGFWDALERARR